MPRSLPTRSVQQERGRPICIVVPVFNAESHARRCLQSVLQHRDVRSHILVIDDCSTEPSLVRWLQALEGEGRIQLLRNERNCGYVTSVNRALRLVRGADMLILNSDTIVTRGFISKLVACAYAEPRTGIVCPLTNNGTICSVPRFARRNEVPAGYTVDSFAALVSRVSRRERPELVTAVGFCMYVRAELLNSIGLFDEIGFARGYGEENDFSERAKRAGFSVRLCDDLFVAHFGGASFGPEAAWRSASHQRVLSARYPNYEADVRRFIRNNPLRRVHDLIRRRLRRARVVRTIRVLRQLWRRAGHVLGGACRPSGRLSV